MEKDKLVKERETTGIEIIYNDSEDLKTLSSASEPFNSAIDSNDIISSSSSGTNSKPFIIKIFIGRADSFSNWW